MKPSIKLRQKKAADFYQKVGLPIKRWLAENKKAGKVPRDQKELADRLECSVYQLSRYITGTSEMPGRIITRLCDVLGFSNKYFMEYYSFTKEKLVPEILTKEDMLRLVFEYQQLINEQKKLFHLSSDKLETYAKENRELIIECRKLVVENNKQTEIIKELKRQLAEKEAQNDLQKHPI